MNKRERKLAEILLSIKDFRDNELFDWWCTKRCPNIKNCSDIDGCYLESHPFTVDDVFLWMKDMEV